LVDENEEWQASKNSVGQFNEINMQDLDLAIKPERNIKSPGIDCINMELWNYGSRQSDHQFLIIF
jgi:hypothetical protein